MLKITQKNHELTVLYNNLNDSDVFRNYTEDAAGQLGKTSLDSNMSSVPDILCKTKET